MNNIGCPFFLTPNECSFVFKHFKGKINFNTKKPLRKIDFSITKYRHLDPFCLKNVGPEIQYAGKSFFLLLFFKMIEKLYRYVVQVTCVS